VICVKQRTAFLVGCLFMKEFLQANYITEYQLLNMNAIFLTVDALQGGGDSLLAS
jgi:hypothetical protein